MFKVNNIKTPEQRQWRSSGVFTVNFERISHLVLVFLLLTLNMQFPAGKSLLELITRAIVFPKKQNKSVGYHIALRLNQNPEIFCYLFHLYFTSGKTIQL